MLYYHFNMTNTAYLPSKHLSIISLILLMAYLCAFASHAQHVDLALDFNETQQCSLCQNNIDTPYDLALSVSPQFICYEFLVNPAVSCASIQITHPRPPPRGPPVY